MHSELILQGRRFNVERRTYIVDDHEIQRDIVIHPGAVVIVPFIGVPGRGGYNDSQIVMIRNFRRGIDESLLELPAGTREPNELSIVTAARELEEETGYKAENIEPLMQFYTSPGITNELMEVFLATNLTSVGQKLEHGEEIEIVEMSIHDVKFGIKKGYIKDGKTIAALGRIFMDGI